MMKQKGKSNKAVLKQKLTIAAAALANLAAELADQIAIDDDLVSDEEEISKVDREESKSRHDKEIRPIAFQQNSTENLIAEGLACSSTLNPFIVVQDMCYYDDKWRFGQTPLDITKLACKFWITDRLFVRGRWCVDEVFDQNVISSITSKIYRCDAKCVTLRNQVIQLSDLSIIISSAEFISFYNVTVKHEEELCSVEKVVEVAVKAKYFSIRFNHPLRCITSKTMKELLKIPHLSNIKQLNINISDDFDIECFYDYMKKNQTTTFELSCHFSNSAAYKTRLEEIIDEIIATKEFNYKPPVIWFAGLNYEKNRYLRHISASVKL